MKYNINWLIQETENIKVDFLMFWGHQKEKDHAITKSCLSQWWEASFILNGIEYLTAEHYMMAEKAKLFGDEEIYKKILTKTSPKDVKDLGRQIKNFNAEKWDAEKFEIVKQGNLLKFSQNQDLKSFLVQTNNKILVEASPVDLIWGIGFAEDDINAVLPKNWKGENLLGFTLMEVRDEIKNINTTVHDI